MLGQNVDSPATGQYAESQGIPWVGYDSDSSNVRAEVVADGVGLQLGPVLPEAGQGGDGRHLEAGLLLRLDQGRVHGARAVRAGRVSAKTKALIAAKKKAIENGSFYEFAGPLYDQSGKLVVPKPGMKLTRQPALPVNWLVKGVIGSPKG